jgi:hypothetical protein
MADGNGGGGGGTTILAVIIGAIIVIAVGFMAFGGGFPGSRGGDSVTIEAPEVNLPNPAPAQPAQ